MRWIHVKFIVILLALSFLASSCVYLNVKFPLSTEFNRTKLGTKTGKSSSHSILWLVAWGDSGTKAAAEKGGIKVIYCADEKVFWFFSACTAG